MIGTGDPPLARVDLRILSQNPGCHLPRAEAHRQFYCRFFYSGCYKQRL